MKEIHRKGYNALLRPPRKFVPNPALDKDDIIHITRQCTCADESPSMDEESGVPDLVDVYTYCGNACGDDTPPARILSYSATNPPALMARVNCGEGGTQACFVRTVSAAERGTVSGVNLGLDDWSPILTADPCEGPPCFTGGDTGCEYFKLQPCDAETGNTDYIYVPAAFWGNMAGHHVVKWLGTCYETTTIPCVSIDWINAHRDQISMPSTSQLTKVDSCDDNACNCCGGVMGTLALIRDAIKERLEFINSGNLPTTVGHDWSDDDYILNGEPETTDGKTSATECYQRAEGWRQWLSECDYWLRTSTYLFNSSSWIDTDTHADANIAGAASISYWELADYTNAIDDYTWFNSAFGTNAVGEYFTMGNVGDYGTISVIRFGDTDQHVIVQNADNLQEFCDLINATADLMLEWVQKLSATAVSASVSDRRGVYYHSELYDYFMTCADFVTCHATRFDVTNWGSIGYKSSKRLSGPGWWSVPNCTQYNESESSIATYTMEGGITHINVYSGRSMGSSFLATGKYSANLSAYPAGSTTAVFIQMAVPTEYSGVPGAPSYFSSSTTPYSLEGGNYQDITSDAGTPTAGSNWTGNQLSFTTNPVDTNACSILGLDSYGLVPSGTVGWRLSNPTITIMGAFAV